MSDSDKPTVDGFVPSPHLVATVGFTRKVNLGNYESADATMFVQVDYPLGTDPSSKEFADRVYAAFTAAKIEVLEQLGLGYQADEDGVIRENGKRKQKPAPSPQAATESTDAEVELIKSTFKGAKEVAAEAVGASDVPAEPPYDPETTDKDEKAANLKWAKARLKVAPNEFWDNRPKKASGKFSAKAPDFKHKDTGIPVWPEK